MTDRRPKLICIKSGCDATDRRYGPVIQPLLGGGLKTGLPQTAENRAYQTVHCEKQNITWINNA